MFCPFSSRSFMVSCLILKSSNHFEFVFVYGVNSGLISLSYMQLSSFPNTTCWRQCFFPIVYSCLLCWRLVDHGCVVFPSFSIMTTMAMKAHVKVWTYGFIFLRCSPGVKLLHHKLTHMLKFLRNCWTIFQSGCTILHHTSHIWEFWFLHILINSCYMIFFWL